MQTDSRIEPVAVPNADSNAIESGAGSAALGRFAHGDASRALRAGIAVTATDRPGNRNPLVLRLPP